MPMPRPQCIAVEVDMVPLIDIISLLLMFLVMVGDMTRATTAVQMKLPRADQAIHMKEAEGRLVVQLDQKKDGRYFANIEGHAFELVRGGGNKSLTDYLERLIAARSTREEFKPGDNGEVPFPVRLRIPELAPMREVERVVMALATAKLVNVQYAAETGRN
jgi:biopolymer transport protein ExbD